MFKIYQRMYYFFYFANDFKVRHVDEAWCRNSQPFCFLVSPSLVIVWGQIGRKKYKTEVMCLLATFRAVEVMSHSDIMSQEKSSERNMKTTNGYSRNWKEYRMLPLLLFMLELPIYLTWRIKDFKSWKTTRRYIVLYLQICLPSRK